MPARPTDPTAEVKAIGVMLWLEHGGEEIQFAPMAYS